MRTAVTKSGKVVGVWADDGDTVREYDPDENSWDEIGSVDDDQDVWSY